MSDPSAGVLRINCPAKLGPWGCSGWLTIEHDAVRFELDAFTKRLAPFVATLPQSIHALEPLRLLRARALPPFLAWTLMVTGTEGLVAVHLWGTKHRAVRDALSNSAVEVVHQRTWVGLGMREARAGNQFG